MWLIVIICVRMVWVVVNVHADVVQVVVNACNMRMVSKLCNRLALRVGGCEKLVLI